MDILKTLKEILAELLDIEECEITPDTYLIKDLGAESIDLLELAVAINSRFDIDVKDDDIFLGNFRRIMADSRQKEKDPFLEIAHRYPFLAKKRIEEIAAKTNKGPQLKIADLIDYISYQLEGGGK